MGCRENCGSCCDPVVLMRTFVDKIYTVTGPLSQQGSWIYDNWSPLSSGEDAQGEFVKLKCRNYDVENRKCLAYESRPPVCRDFPWYGGEPVEGRIGNVCGYQEELGRKLLPIVEVR